MSEPVPKLFGRWRALVAIGVVAGLLLVAARLGDLPTGLGRRGTPALMVAGLVSLLGMLGVAAGIAALPAYLRLRRYTRVDTAAAAPGDGLVALRGTITQSDGGVPALLSETTAVARTTRISTAAVDDAPTEYTEVAVTDRASAFRIDDGAGERVIVPDTADVFLAPATRQTFPPTRDRPAAVEHHLTETASSVDTATRRVRVDEAVLEVGDAVYVAGTADTAITADLIAAADYPAVLRSRIVRYGGGGSVVMLAGGLGIFALAGVI